jgi:hypothetical protein
LVFGIKGRTWRIFKNGALRRIFGPKRDDIIGDRKKNA